MRAFLPLLTLLLLAAAPPGDDAGTWPFAAPDGDRLARGLDLYNLGLVGAKAWDGRKPLPEAPKAGRRQVQLTGAGGPDVGPKSLRVIVLMPGGPGEQAGLEVGDVIVAAGGQRFGKGSFAPLAKALCKAGSRAEDGELKLKVEREGHKGTLSLEVAIPSQGKGFAKPTKPAFRRALGLRALDWLAARQAEGGGFAETLSGVNGAVVQTALAGLAWLAGGSTLTEGPHSEQLRGAVSFVQAQAGKTRGGDPEGANWSQVNWGWAHAAIFLGEAYAVSPSDELLAQLQRCADALLANQERSGGWAHGPGGENALGYLELNIVSGLALSGLGLARRAGCELDEERILKAALYVEASSGGGGVGYSTRDGQVGSGNIGRSAGVWLGYRNLGLKRRSAYKQLSAFVKREAANYLGGHASLMQHILLAGVAASAEGGKVSRGYWQALERDLVLALAPDGSFQPRPWHETVASGSNTDVSFGEVWTTAAWAIVLLADGDKTGGGLPAWTAR